MEGLQLTAFILVTFTIVISVNASNSTQVQCFKCNGVPKMEDCGHTVTCGEHEECYVRRSVGTVGNVLYESGCISRQVCKQLSQIGRKRSTDRRKRAFVNCLQCCNSELCNKHLCTKQPEISNHIECFACNDVLMPEHCKNTVLCGLDQECRTDMRLLSTNYELRYTLDCGPKALCRALENDQVADKNYCVQCCNKNYCNPKLCGFLSKARPVMTVKPQDRNVLPGDKIELQCLIAHIDGLPFNITWTHQDSNKVVTTPPVQLMSESQILDMTITAQHYGYWTCSARNQNGVVNATALIKPPVPSG
ncbi:uncharacterized protein [Mytilus edulis]|uniref:uncharacterized protein n=1 Tax=Mytilus edulis TaxID=6550 RepID=UPI0039EF7F56